MWSHSVTNHTLVVSMYLCMAPSLSLCKKDKPGKRIPTINQKNRLWMIMVFVILAINYLCSVFLKNKHIREVVIIIQQATWHWPINRRKSFKIVCQEFVKSNNPTITGLCHPHKIQFILQKINVKSLHIIYIFLNKYIQKWSLLFCVTGNSFTCSSNHFCPHCQKGPFFSNNLSSLIPANTLCSWRILLTIILIPADTSSGVCQVK